MDMMNLRKIEREAGWHFDAIIVILDDTVVYKLWGGQPTMAKWKEKKNPLGPFMGLKDMML